MPCASIVVMTALPQVGPRCTVTLTSTDGRQFLGSAEVVREPSGSQCLAYTGQLVDIPRLRFQPPEIVVAFSNVDAGAAPDTARH